MAKRSTGKSVGRRVKSKPKDVLLRLRIATRYITHGKVTGKRYEFPKAGASLPVDAGDAEYLLSLKRKNLSCCGGVGENIQNIFEKV